MDLATYTRRTKEFERFMTFVFPTLEINAAIDKTFWPKNASISRLMAIEQRAIDNLGLLYSKLPTPQLQDRFIQRCVPWWREMRRVRKMIRELAIQDLKEQGIDLTKAGTA
jgi:hypothetical protein